MSGIIKGLIGGSVAGIATAVGSLPLFSKNSYIQAILNKIKFDFFLGLMLTATFLGLLVPAFKETHIHSPKIIFLSMMGGVSFVLVTKKIFAYYFQKMESKKSADEFRAIIFVMAIIIQNIPEGLAAGASMTMSNTVSAISLLSVIAIQDLTEGITTGLSLFSLGLTKRQAFLGVVFTGVIEAFFGVIGGHLSSTILGIMPIIMAFAGGAMLAVTLTEVIEKIKSTHFRFLYNSNFISGIVMMVAINQIH